jgi:hypothetical protein
MDTVCPGCGLRRPAEDGPVHAYMTASPACWRLYGEVLAREYATPELMAIHRLSVDAYALQHPGGQDRRSVQSVGFHLSRLWLTLDRDLSAAQANRLALRLVERKTDFTWLAPPPDPAEITCADVAAAATPPDHAERVQAWARSVLAAWRVHHAQAAAWVRDVEGA